LIWDLVTTHGYVQPANIRLRPAASTLLHSPCGERWIATGDAAASFDPLSSHGIASALANGNYAGLAIAAALAGDESSFSTYTDRLRADYAHYLWLHQAYYRDEHRWLDLPFWTRRHGSESHPRRRCRTAFTTDARGRFARLCGPA
jgi:2-polyprenyl-6-methoxyphenol hydroxylase-like FAD-dependent oxidoreductase